MAKVEVELSASNRRIKVSKANYVEFPLDLAFPEEIPFSDDGSRVMEESTYVSARHFCRKPNALMPGAEAYFEYLERGSDPFKRYDGPEFHAIWSQFPHYICEGDYRGSFHVMETDVCCREHGFEGSTARSLYRHRATSGGRSHGS